MPRQLDLTVQGVVGTNPVLSRVGSGARPYCRFRVAVTPTFRTDHGWQDGDTMWFTAKAWGRLAENACLSLRKGDPVLLTGRLSEDVWSTDEGTHSTNVITLQSAGHDLTRGESRFARVRTADSAREPAGDPGAADQSSTDTAPSASTPPAAVPLVEAAQDVHGDLSSGGVPGSGSLPGGERETAEPPSYHWGLGAAAPRPLVPGGPGEAAEYVLADPQLPAAGGSGASASVLDAVSGAPDGAPRAVREEPTS